MFEHNHFRPDLTEAEAEALFRKFLQVIDVSISSYCNRRCPYCPNSKADRISSKHLMSDGLFSNILRHLCQIDFRGVFHINRYNEPLADRDYALRRIRQIMTVLPDTKINIYTNGDYLDASYVRELSDAGVSELYACVHEAAGGTGLVELIADLDRRLSRLGLPFVYRTNAAGKVQKAVVDCGSAMRFVYVAQDFHRRDENGVLWMEDRGQSLSVSRGMVRLEPCFVPFLQMSIEWDGEVLPCCQIQPDVFAKNQYSLGRLTESSNVFLAWSSASFVQWRKDVFSYEIKKSPCTSCGFGPPVKDGAGLRPIVEAWRQALGLNGGTPGIAQVEAVTA